MEKIIRTICVFSDKAGDEELALLDRVASLLVQKNYLIQTKRICLSKYEAEIDDKELNAKGVMLGMGTLTLAEMKKVLPDFLASDNKSVNLDLTNENISLEYVDVLFEIIKHKPANTFNFTFGFNLPGSSPYFPSAKFEKPGFSIGLQSTNLSKDCQTLEQWFDNMKIVWQEIDDILKPIEGYVGIDSSIAPMNEAVEDESSFINFIRRLGYDFSRSATTDIYTRTTKFIKENNPHPIGLCGLMFPCLEDLGLAQEYEQGNFTIERNIFLSLHSGVGIDTYPIAIDEDRNRVVEILKLVQQLSNKYQKPLSARFVSDGKAKIGEMTNLKNQYLKDVVVNKL